jgi:hypothetical protein
MRLQFITNNDDIEITKNHGDEKPVTQNTELASGVYSTIFEDVEAGDSFNTAGGSGDKVVIVNVFETE